MSKQRSRESIRIAVPAGTKARVDGLLKDGERRRDFARLAVMKEIGARSGVTFAEAAARFRRAGRSPRFLDKLEAHWGDRPVAEISKGDVREAAMLLYPSAKNSTRNRQAIGPTLAVINHAAELGLCHSLSVRMLPVERRERGYATWEWVETLVAHASPALGALAVFMILTGARISEALDVRWADLDLDGPSVLIRQTKVGAERRAHLPAAAVAAIRRIDSNREPDERVFRYSSRHTAKAAWHAAIGRAGLPRLTFHACRHGFATALLRKGVDPVTIARLGGWSSPAQLFSTYGHARADISLADVICEQ